MSTSTCLRDTIFIEFKLEVGKDDANKGIQTTFVLFPLTCFPIDDVCVADWLRAA